MVCCTTLWWDGAGKGRGWKTANIIYCWQQQHVRGRTAQLSDISSGATWVADLDSRALALTKEASGNSRAPPPPPPTHTQSFITYIIWIIWISIYSCIQSFFKTLSVETNESSKTPSTTKEGKSNNKPTNQPIYQPKVLLRILNDS